MKPERTSTILRHKMERIHDGKEHSDQSALISAIEQGDDDVDLLRGTLRGLTKMITTSRLSSNQPIGTKVPGHHF